MKKFNRYHIGALPLLTILSMSPSVMEHHYRSRSIASETVVAEEKKEEIKKEEPKIEAKKEEPKIEEKKEVAKEEVKKEEPKKEEVVVVDPIKPVIIEDIEILKPIDIVDLSPILLPKLEDLKIEEEVVAEKKEEKKDEVKKDEVKKEEPKTAEAPKKEEEKKPELVVKDEKKEDSKEEQKKEEKKEEKKAEICETDVTNKAQLDQLTTQVGLLSQMMNQLSQTMMMSMMMNQMKSMQQSPMINPYHYHNPFNVGEFTRYSSGYQPSQSNIFDIPSYGRGMAGFAPDNAYYPQNSIWSMRPTMEFNQQYMNSNMPQFSPGSFGGQQMGFNFSNPTSTVL